MMICEFSIQNQNFFTIINRFKFEYSRNEMQNNVNTKFGADENCDFFRFWRILSFIYYVSVFRGHFARFRFSLQR